MIKERNIANLPLDGGLLCLDFVNTVQTRKRDVFHEYLPDYSAFLQWCLKVAIVDSEEAQQLGEWAATHPKKAGDVYMQLIAARTMLYRFFSQKAEGRNIDSDVLQQFNALLSVSLRNIKFRNGDQGLEQSWAATGEDLNAPLWRVMKSAYDILGSHEAKYIKECSACGWLFLDKSRTHTRRWCNPLECGSVDKATRYYHRTKAKNSGIKKAAG